MIDTYEKPEVKVVEFDQEDIVMISCVSGMNPGGPGDIGD